MNQSFRIEPLSSQQFEQLFGLSTEELNVQGIEVMNVDSVPGYPCRVSLEDAPLGSEVLLLNYYHLPVETPFRSKGPIFVRRNAKAPTLDINEVPPMLRNRMLSLRGYDTLGMMLEADVFDGACVESKISELFANPEVDFLDIHFAKRGCFACRVNRA